MIDEEKDKLIAKALGVHWHKWLSNTALVCYHCKDADYDTRGLCLRKTNPDFSTWEGFGLIMERGPGRKWWEAFSYCVQQTRTPYAYWRKDLWPIDLLNPTKTHDTLFSWLSENEGEWREK